MTEIILATTLAALIVTGLLARQAWRWREEARELSDDAQQTYDYAVGLIRESTETYKEATREVEKASRLNRETFAHMASAIEEPIFPRGRRLN